MKNKITIIFAIVQMVLLINIPVSNSYLMSKTENIFKINIKEREILKKGLNLVIGIFSIKQIGVVSAQALRCCPKTKQGAICQNMEETDESECAVDLAPTSCEQYSECKIGCCFDENEGLCSTQTPKGACEENGGIWDSSNACNQEQCKRGCCVLGKDALFVTERRCSKISLMQGFDYDFRAELDSEVSCLALKETQKSGACLFYEDSEEEKKCVFQTEIECAKQGGEFFEDYLCSNPELNTSCEKQSSVACIEGKDEIYWIDSCGNKENIYDADKEKSWNNGMVLEKSKSCGENSGNIDSKECGNCNYALGSKCSISARKKVKDGAYGCQNLNCVDENGKQRKNGESWCVYEGEIGKGQDLVGSRHWKRMCVEGRIETEPCADYRNGLCTQTEIKNNETSETYSIASCVPNKWATCLSESGCKEKSNDCRKHVIQMGSQTIDVCVPNYAPGFDLTTEDGQKKANKQCSQASLTCKVTFVDGECKQNCNCLEADFINKAHEFCYSLGDCGFKINIAGRREKNAFSSGTPYSPSAVGKLNPTKKFFVKADSPGVIEALAGKKMNPPAVGDSPEAGYTPEELAAMRWAKMAGVVLGGLGGASASIAWAFGYWGVLGGSAAGQAVWAQGLAGFGNVLGAMAIGATIGMFAGQYAAKFAGVRGKGAQVIAIAGALGGAGGAGLAYIVLQQGGASWVWGFLLPGFGIIIGILIALILVKGFGLFGGDGKVEVRNVEFKCQAWQPPVGGEDCSKCNEDPLKPCSRYRCQSLGRACKLLNENTENPLCASITKENIPPKISAGEISSNFSFLNEEERKVEIRKNNGECIPEFTPIMFQLNTDEPAQCKYGLVPRTEYQNMTDYPLEQNIFSLNHTFVFAAPSLESFFIYNLTKKMSQDLREMYGKMNLYVRCQDYFGNENKRDYEVNMCVETGPDLTPPKVSATIPANNAIISYGTNKTEIIVYLNEPSECKYSFEDIDYDLMNNSMTCSANLLEPEVFGWPCKSNISVNSGENEIYIRCKDKPWLQEFNKTRNKNTESFVYKLSVSEKELEISSISPNADIKTGEEPTDITLEVKTANGAENGKAVCEYRFSGQGSYIELFETSSTIHNQKFNDLFAGDYLIEIRCRDIAGNFDYKNTSFKIKVDKTPPQVVRVWLERENLKIITNEEASCSYSLGGCSFRIKNGTSMSYGFGKEHTLKSKDTRYYIKCEDVWGNKPDFCSIIVSPNLFR